jgi:hypothetical protein
LRAGDKCEFDGPQGVSKTVRRILYTALILAVALGVNGWLILSLKEPYQDPGSSAAGR